MFAVKMQSVFETSDPASGLVVGLDVTPLPPRSGGPVLWAFSVANRGHEARTLMFPSGQQGEVVLEADGVERYRWSRDKAFVLMITERELDAGEMLSFSLEDVLDVEPGRYSLVASVTASPSPPKLRTQLTVAG
jgi:Intracellular proteinase inhibitor